MQAGQSVAQNVTITGLPRKSFRAIFLPVIVVNFTSGILAENRLIAFIEMTASASVREANRTNRGMIISVLRGERINCSGTYNNALLGNIGIIAKLLNYMLFLICHLSALFYEKFNSN